MAGRKRSEDTKTAAGDEVGKALSLPVSVTGPSDIGRLVRELESVDEALMEAGLRKGAAEKLPKTSGLLDQAVWVNKLNLLKQGDRAALQTFLNDVRKQAPVLHISFSADPSPDFLEKLVAWFRREVHPSVLLTIGLQPNIGAGCILRTTNKQFDLSLRQDFLSKRGLLLEQLSKPEPAVAEGSAPAPQPAAAPQGPEPAS